MVRPEREQRLDVIRLLPGTVMFVVLAVMALWSEFTDNTAALNAMHANPAVDYWDVEREVSCHGGEMGLPGACLARVSDKCLPTFVIAGAMNSAMN